MEAPESARASVRDFLNVIFKRKYQISLFFLVTFSTVAVATLLARPAFEATGQILVKPGRENIYLPATGSNNPVVSINREEQLNSEIEILKNRALAQEVVETLGAAYLYPSLAKKDKGDSATDLSRSRDEALLLKDALLKFDKNLDVRGIKKSNIIEIGFKHTNPQMAAAVVDMLAQLYIDKHVAVYKTPHSYEFFLQQSDFLKDKLTRTENKLKDLKAQYNITALAEQQAILLQRIHDLRMSLNQTRSQEVEVNNRVQLVGQLLDLYQKELDEFNKIEVLHNQLQQEADVDRRNYQLYLTKYEESRISDAMDSQKIASVHLIEPAQIPLKPVSPRVLLNLILGLFLGAFGGLGLAFFLHYLDDSLETVEDVEDALGVPVLISISDHGPGVA